MKATEVGAIVGAIAGGVAVFFLYQMELDSLLGWWVPWLGGLIVMGGAYGAWVENAANERIADGEHRKDSSEAG